MSGYLTFLSVRRTEEFVSNAAEIMEIEAWINWKIDISDCFREAIPVMPLREKGRPRNDKSAGSSSRTMFRNQRGSVTNGKKMVLGRPILVVWILTESACHLGGGRTCQCPPVKTP
ncbi:hypothetical protein TNCV_3773831 [Trichonephila clavipes]|nr:hypothetical protein TNCV_3773831 [Trichonephila clavipes]